MRRDWFYSIWCCCGVVILFACLCKALKSPPKPRINRINNCNYFTTDIVIPSLSSKWDSHDNSIPVRYTNSPSAVSSWLEKNVPSRGTLVGFDVESNPTAPWVKVKFQGPATVQMAVVDAALVVQLVDSNGNPADDTIPVLRAVLSDESIIKAGVGIDQDMLELYREFGCDGDFRGRFDIGGIGGEDGRTVSLKWLTEAVVGIEMEKSKKVAVSNWGQVPLSSKQIAYCARDAWAAAVIVSKLAETEPDTFSSSALINLLEDETSMSELDKRALKRKIAKTRYLEIVGKGDDRIAFRDLPDDLRKEATSLTETMRELAPPSPFIFPFTSSNLNSSAN